MRLRPTDIVLETIIKRHTLLSDVKLLTGKPVERIVGGNLPEPFSA